MALETATNDNSSALFAGDDRGTGGTGIADGFNMTSLQTLLTTTSSMGLSDSPSTNPLMNPWTAGLVAEYAIRIVFSVLMVLVNTLVLLTLGTTPSLRCPTNLVIGSLAVTDLLVGLLSPAGLVIELQIVEVPLLCRMGYASVMALSSVSINHLLFVSIDRYLLIGKPLRYGSLVTRRRVWAFIVICWVWAVALSVPFLLGLSINPDWDGECRAELMYPLWFIILLTLLHFVLPFLVMLYVHIKIFIVARRQQKAVKDSFRRNGVELGGVSCGNRAKLRAARLLVLPCGYFYISWGPFFITVLYTVATDTVVEPHALERFVQTLAILNSLGNPILYAVSQPVLGRAMMAKLTAIWRKCLTAYKGKHCESDTLVPPEQADLSTTV
ncbi:adenosine receptor A2b-like [Littorina saxatilis]|uniref:G-protein coupled receptors family 1 profile domain-containing protein n=1 Tax=Littorina saxatilis TaxID=31220 RepID=A0AAN9B825_9CAEN